MTMTENGTAFRLTPVALNNTKRVITDLLTYEEREIFQLVNYAFICMPLSLFGIGANVANVVVFVSQGFKDSMNISLFGLAIADFACLLTVFWTTICFNPYFMEADLPFHPMEIMYLTGGYSHVCFSRTTSFITAFITLERCLCITVPLKVKTIITPERTKIIIIVIFVVNLVVFSPFYYVNTLVSGFDPQQNKTTLSLVYADNRQEVETITFYIHSVAMTAIALSTVIICSIILVVKLNQKTKWRKTATATARTAVNPEVVSAKDKKVVKMVTVVSLIFIICFMPATIIFFMMSYEPEYSFSGGYQNIFFSIWTVTFVLETINSSVNIFVYYNMSTKFRATLLQKFCGSTEKS